MRMHVVTIGQPKLAYARVGWEEYLTRLQRHHQVRVTHVPDKYAYDATRILQACGEAYIVALVIGGNQYNSPELADFLEKRALDGREVCFVIGGPEGLPEQVIQKAQLGWGLSKLTFPHDLAMVVMMEALYRASTINDGLPYHK
jgi:23S rRNA (pseudouridine1915-N3)-methyltransferase